MIPKFEAVCLEKAAEAEMVEKRAAEAALEFDEIRFADRVTQDALKQQLSAKAKELEASSVEMEKLRAELDTVQQSLRKAEEASASQIAITQDALAKAEKAEKGVGNYKK